MAATKIARNDDLVDAAVGCIAQFRAARPHIHCITNAVAQNFTANVILAAGATPSMTVAPDEIEGFVRFADAVLINLGTLDADRIKASRIAQRAARTTNKMVALDPVFVQASPPRLAFARELLDQRPDIVRANRFELSALLGQEFNMADPGTAASKLGVTIALTGKEDVITDGKRRYTIGNGASTMASVTAMGCALTALMAGMAAVSGGCFEGCVAAALLFGVAGEVADESSSGPGTFAPRFIDALANIDEAALRRRAKLT